jgi:hypothetical protein
MFPLALISITSLLLLADTIGSTSTVFQRTGLHSYDFMVATLIALFGLRMWNGTTIPKVFRKLLIWVAIPVITITTTVLTLLDYHLPINTIFAYTGLQVTHLLLLTLFLILVALISQPTIWWRSHWQKVLTTAPFAAFLYMLLVRSLEFNMFFEIVKEDRPIEYLQFFILAFGGMQLLIVGAKLAWTHWNILPLNFHSFVTSNFMKLGIVAAGLALLLIAGDEISWGQRLFHFETPDSLAEINRQEEVTFHNTYAVEWLVIYAYTFISLFGLLAWPVGKGIINIFKAIRQFACYQWLRPFLSLLPQPHAFGFFLFPSYFFVQQLRNFGGIYQPWSEVAELSLYAGLVVWLIGISFQVVYVRNSAKRN